MHVVYGIAVPPGLDGDTRGEVRVRVERLMLRKDQLADGRDGWELEACVVHPVWWGDKQTDRKSNARCTPSTPETARGVTTFVFPVKTLRPQLEAYFAHMNAADEGLNLNVVVPASASGKRRDVPLGAASLRLEALTPKAAIAGWFTVVSASGTEAIGRVKLHVSVQYFDAPKRSPGKPASTAATEHIVEAADVPVPSHPADAAANEEVNARSSSAAPTPAAAPPVQSEGQPGATSVLAAHTSGNHASQATAGAAPGIAAAPPTPTATPPSGVMMEQIEHVFRRGLEIRAAMMQAASPATAPAAEHGASSQRAATRFASVFDGARFGLSANNVEPSLVDAIAFRRHDDDVSGGTDDSEDDDLSVSSSAESDAAPAQPRHSGVVHHHHHRHPQQRPQPLQRPQQHSPSQGHHHQMIRDPCLFRIRLVSVSLAARGFDACQFSLRVSRDVLFTQPPPDPMWSACFELPLQADSGAFTLPVTAYSPGSKAVIEVFGISHQRRSVSLLGIAMVPLAQAHHNAVDFRCPTTSTVEAQAEVAVERAAVEAAVPRQQHPMRDEAAMKARVAGPVIQMPSAGAAASLTCPPQSAHEPPKHYRVVDALVGSPQAPEDTNAATLPHASTALQHAAADRSREVPPLPAHHQYQHQAALVPQAVEGHVLALRVSSVKAMPKMELPGAERPRPPRVVIAIDGLRDTHGHVLDDWNCETDAFVAHAALRDDGSGVLELETTIGIGEHTAVESIASVTLRVFALAPMAADDMATGNVVTTAELMAHCVDIGEVIVDVRTHLRFHGPPADGWYHVRTAGGTAGQLRVSCASS